MSLKFKHIFTGIGMGRRHIYAQHFINGFVCFRIDQLAVSHFTRNKLNGRLIPEIAKNGPGYLDRCRTADPDNSDTCFSHRRSNRRNGFGFQHHFLQPCKDPVTLYIVLGLTNDYFLAVITTRRNVSIPSLKVSTPSSS